MEPAGGCGSVRLEGRSCCRRYIKGVYLGGGGGGGDDTGDGGGGEIRGKRGRVENRNVFERGCKK